MENARYGDLNSDIPVCLSTDTPQHVTCLHRQNGYRSKRNPPGQKKISLAEVVFSFSIVFPISQFKETRFLAPKTKNMKGINWQCRAESAAAPSFAPMYACDHLINSNSAKSTSESGLHKNSGRLVVG